MQLSLMAQIGNRCVSLEDGQKVYHQIHEHLKNEETVRLNFEDVTQVSLPFFNGAIGTLLQDIEESVLRKYLIIENLNHEGRSIIERVKENFVMQKNFGAKDYTKEVEDLIGKPIS